MYIIEQVAVSKKACQYTGKDSGVKKKERHREQDLPYQMEQILFTNDF